MKLRSLPIIAALTIFLAACNYTLAEDVTPPPGYVPPTPLPTLVLSPAQAPSVENGRAIYAEKCVGCHGETGLGDGPQGIQLGVTVPAFGLPEIARPATPADWFTTVTRGRMDRLMPPFASLNDEQRWDVVSYAMSLHITDEMAAKGKQIFETSCKDCQTDFFKDQSKMSKLSEVDLARIVRQGTDGVPAFGKNLSEDNAWNVAAYLRTLAFDYTTEQAQAPASTSTPGTVSATQTPGEGTPLAGTAQATAGVGTEQVTSEAAASQPTVVAQPGFGTVSGSIENKTGQPLPADMKVTLRGFDHGADQTTGPQEVFSQDGVVNSDGTYTFSNIEMPTNRIFLTEVVQDGVTLQSQFAVAKEGDASVAIPAIVLYEITNDASKLVIDEVRSFADYGDTEIQYYNVYSFHNPSDKTIVIDTNNNTEASFIKMPEGTSSLGVEPLQDSEKFINTDKGLAIPPSENSYGLLAFTTLPKKEKYDIAQPFILPVASYTVFLPEGVTASSTSLTDHGAQTIQNFNFQVYTTENVAAGETVNYSVSGEPKVTTSNTDAAAPSASTSTKTNQGILVGGGLLGIALIAAGGWLFWRDRKRGAEEVEEEQQEFESSEDVLDAIVTLDDLHRAGKISDEAYQKRRTELKDILKEMM